MTVVAETESFGFGEEEEEEVRLYIHHKSIIGKTLPSLLKWQGLSANLSCIERRSFFRVRSLERLDNIEEVSRCFCNGGKSSNNPEHQQGKDCFTNHSKRRALSALPNPNPFSITNPQLKEKVGMKRNGPHPYFSGFAFGKRFD